MKNFTQEEILAHLDSIGPKPVVEGFPFPGIFQVEGYNWNGKSKLKVYLNNTQWILVIECFSFWERSEDRFTIDLQAAMSDNDTNSLYSRPDSDVRTTIIEASPNDPYFDEEWNFRLNLFDFELIIKGELQHFKLNEQDYANAGINLEEKNIPNYAKILRIIGHLIPGKLFLTDTEILTKLGCENEGFELFLELDEWKHPSDDDWKYEPSRYITFQSIAEAIAKRDASLYHCPKELCDSHWSYQDVNMW